MDSIALGSDFNICVVRHAAPAHRLAKLSFGPDGSLYVMFPEIRGLPGVLAKGRFPVLPGRKRDIDLGEIGKSTSHLVKFSYHPNGRVHFSQTGKVRTEVISYCEPLLVQTGHLFSVRIQGLAKLGSPRAADRTPKIGFALTKPSDGITLAAWRFSDRWLSGRVKPFDHGGVALTNDDGTIQLGVLCGPPAGSIFSDHKMMLALEETGVFATDTEVALAFLGGFSAPVLEADGTPYRSILIGIYPSTDTTPDGIRIPSMDFP